MILNKFGDRIEINGTVYTIGMTVIGTEKSEYEGLNGYITEIRTEDDRDTENIGPDIYCSFEPPENPQEITRLEAVFSELYGQTKYIEDIVFDLVIMAPDMITPVQSDDTADAVMEYFMAQYEKSPVRVVPGHWPKFQSKAEVDEWIDNIAKIFTAFQKNQ